MIDKVIQILDANERLISDVYAYNFSSELMGKHTIAVEFIQPIQYDNNAVEIPFKFDINWHIYYGDDIFYLTTDTPTGEKNNTNRTIKYNLIFASRRNLLEDIFVKPFGKVYTDNDNDGYAGTSEVISDIIVGNAIGFYGDIYDFCQWMRKCLECTFGFITDSNGNNVLYNGKVTPKYTAKLNNISYTQQAPVRETLYNCELADKYSVQPHYSITEKKNIEAKGQTFFAMLQKMNEVFTYKKTLDGIEKKIGYTYDFKTEKFDINGVFYEYYTILINPRSDVVSDRDHHDIIFRYGGLSNAQGGLLSITRTTQDQKLPTRVYGVGSGDNLTPNYFYIKEDRRDERWFINGRKIKSVKDLADYYENSEEEIDKTKFYLIPNDKYPFIYDRYSYNKGLKHIATSSVGQSTATAQFVSTIRKVDAIDTVNNTITIGSQTMHVAECFVYLHRDHDNMWYAYTYYKQEDVTKWIGVWAELGMASYNQTTLLPRIPNGFETNGTTYNVPRSDLVLVKDMENIPEVLESAKIYIVLSQVTDSPTEYTATILKSGIINGWTLAEDYSTYERVNPYLKYISNVQELMPAETRSYVAGWRFGFLFAHYTSQHSPTDVSQSYVIDNSHRDIADWSDFHVDTWHKHYIYIKKDIYPLAFIPAYNVYENTLSQQDSVDWDLLGILETENGSEYYNKDVFEIGLKDFCIGLTYDGSQYDYTQCGNIWRPIDYYQNNALVQRYGIVEKRQDFQDIKPTITDVYYDNLGRLDELVDVYVPCLDQDSSEEDKSNPDKWGKYWEDTAFIVTDTETNRRYNTKVPDLIFPDNIEQQYVEFASNSPIIIDQNHGSLGITSTKKFVDFYNINNSEQLYNDPSYRFSLDIRDASLSFTYDSYFLDGTPHINEIMPLPMRYNINVLVLFLAYNVSQDQNGQYVYTNLFPKWRLLGTAQSNVEIRTKFISDDGTIIDEFYPSETVIGTDNIYVQKKSQNGLILKELVFYSNGLQFTALTQDELDHLSDTQDNNTLCYIDGTYYKVAFNTDFRNLDGWKKYTWKFASMIACGVNFTFNIRQEIDTHTYRLEYVRDIEEVSRPASFSEYISVPLDDLRIEFKAKVVNGGYYGRNIKSKTSHYHRGAYNQLGSGFRALLGNIATYRIKVSAGRVFDYTSREFFAYLKDIKFDPSINSFRGDAPADIVFSTGDLQGIENRFAFSNIVSHNTKELVEDETRTIYTNKEDGSTDMIYVNSKYRATLQFILPDTADNQSTYKYLPQRNIKPKQGDLFILENVIYPHNPYVYEAERRLSKALKDSIDADARLTYSIVFDDIRREQLGIDNTQLKVGNKIKIQNNSLVTTNNEYSLTFEITAVSIQKSEDSRYDKYTLTLKNYTKQKRLSTTISKNVLPISPTAITDLRNSAVNTNINNNRTINTLRAELELVNKTAESTNQSTTNNTLHLSTLQLDVDGKIEIVICETLPKELKNNTIYNILEEGSKTKVAKAIFYKNGAQYEYKEATDGKVLQVLNGVKDGKNQIFTVPNKYKADSTELYINGVRYFNQYDYWEFDGNGIKMNTYIPQKGDTALLLSTLE